MSEKSEQATSVSSEVNFPVILHNFLRTLLRLIWIVLIVALTCGGVRYLRTTRSYVPLYQATTVMHIQASYNASTDFSSYSSYYDTAAVKQLNASFSYIMSSEDAMLRLRATLGGRSPAAYRASAVADSALFYLYANSADPQLAYDTLCAVMEVFPIAASDIVGNIRVTVIDSPELPTEPYNSNQALRSGAKTALIVLLLGVGCCFLLSLTRKTVHSSEDLRKLINLKCLAYIPAVRFKKHSNKSALSLTIQNPRIDPSFRESLRSLRVKLQNMLTGEGCRVLLVTSTLPNEGKTTVAANLALALAEEKCRVLLIDGDLRKQSLKGIFGITEESDGLGDILKGKVKNPRLLNAPDSSLLLLSGGTTVERPQPLLDNPRMGQLFDFLRGKLDYIIIDTPPAGILSDASVLAKVADCALYVVRQDLANTAQIVNSIQTFSDGDCPIIGCVLNQTQAGTTRYGYSSKYGYGSKYSYGAYSGYHSYRNKQDRSVEEAETTDE